MPLRSRLLMAGGGTGSYTVPPFDWTVSGAAATLVSLAAMYATNAITITVAAVVKAVGYQPAAIYAALWTRDQAYVLWHDPGQFTAAQRRQFVTYYLSRRTTGVEADPDGGTLPADWIADRITSTGTATYKNAAASHYPFMDGIAFVVLALWSDWNLTGDTTTFVAQQSAIDACLAVLPRSANGCVYSDPATPSVDYGFCDTVLKTGDVAYGTALLAWAYKMCAQMAGEAGVGTYSTARAHAEAGLATLRQASGWYKGSSVNNAARDDVWATALIVAEDLVGGTDQLDSAHAIADAYSAGAVVGPGYVSEITQFGLVRHLPTGQYWVGTSTTADTYQNGAYWMTPVWDCVRAVQLVDPALALTWAAEAVQQVIDEHTNEADWTKVPYEWHFYPGGVGAKGYSASAAVLKRFE